MKNAWLVGVIGLFCCIFSLMVLAGKVDTGPQIDDGGIWGADGSVTEAATEEDVDTNNEGLLSEDEVQAYLESVENWAEDLRNDIMEDPEEAANNLGDVMAPEDIPPPELQNIYARASAGILEGTSSSSPYAAGVGQVLEPEGFVENLKFFADTIAEKYWNTVEY